MPRADRNARSSPTNPRVRGPQLSGEPCGGRVRTVEELLEELVNAVEARGRACPGELPGSLLDVVVGRVRCTLSSAESRDGPARSGRSLSPREREIAQMMARGLPNKVIADVLEISLWTVGTHIRRLFAKLGVQSRAAAVALLLEAGEIRAGGGDRDAEPPRLPPLPLAAPPVCGRAAFGAASKPVRKPADPRSAPKKLFGV